MYNDLTNKRFGQLTALHKVPSSKTAKDRSAHWLCRCDCGNEVVRRSKHLSVGDTKGCGCLWKTGYEGVNGTYFGNIKARIKSSGMSFDLTPKFLWELYLKQEKKCALSGVSISLAESYSRGEQTASVDRIDSSKGYTQDNVQWLHKEVNQIKSDHSQEHFLEWVRLIHTHQESIG